jgi:flagellar L-ring protein precursor FlgH
MKLYLSMWVCAAAAFGADNKASSQSPLDRYVQEAQARSAAIEAQPATGAVWSPQARLINLASDFRATRVDDLVTIVVTESASAIARGTTSATRAASARAGVSAIGGITRAAGPLANLANLSGQSSLEGEGATSRETVLSTTLAARVTHVLPNGYMVVEGSKEITVNSERQFVTIRGVIRPVDLATNNTVGSERLGQLEVTVNGKGVVGDAIRRPFFLYRLLLGILPF